MPTHDAVPACWQATFQYHLYLEGVLWGLSATPIWSSPTLGRATLQEVVEPGALGLGRIDSAGIHNHDFPNVLWECL